MGRLGLDVKGLLYASEDVHGGAHLGRRSHRNDIDTARFPTERIWFAFDFFLSFMSWFAADKLVLLVYDHDVRTGKSRFNC